MSDAHMRQGYWLAGGSAIVLAAVAAYWSGQVSPIDMGLCIVGGLALSLFGLIYARIAGDKIEAFKAAQREAAARREGVRCGGILCEGRVQLSRGDAKEVSGLGFFCARCFALQFTPVGP